MFFKIITLAVIIMICILLMQLQAKEMYKWTDEDGTVHITDKRSEVPADVLDNIERLQWNKDDSEYTRDEELNSEFLQFQPPENYVDSIVDTDYERKLKKEWRARAKEIEDRKNDIDYKLRNAKQQYKYRKKELDYLLTEGYTVDARINELRSLGLYIEELEKEEKLVAPQMDNLRTQARKAGIPEGYLRP